VQVEKRSPSRFAKWQTRYLWIKGKSMYYTKSPSDDLSNANSVAIDVIKCVQLLGGVGVY
jgi:hypothetical protein